MRQPPNLNAPPGMQHPRGPQQAQAFHNQPPPPPPPPPNGAMRCNGGEPESAVPPPPPPPPSMNGFVYDPETRLPLRAPPGIPFPVMFSPQAGAMAATATYPPPMQVDPTPPVTSLIDVTPPAVAASDLRAHGSSGSRWYGDDKIETSPLPILTATTIPAPAPLVASHHSDPMRFDFTVDPPRACMVEHCLHPMFCELAPCGCRICREHLGSIIRASRVVGADEQGRRTKAFKCLSCQTESFTVAAMGQNGEQDDEIERGQYRTEIQNEDTGSMFSIHYTLPSHSVPVAMGKQFPAAAFGFPVDPSWWTAPLPQIPPFSPEIPPFSPEMNQAYDVPWSANSAGGAIRGGFGGLSPGQQQQQQQIPPPLGFQFPFALQGFVFPPAPTNAAQGFSTPPTAMPPPYMFPTCSAPPSYSMASPNTMPMVHFHPMGPHHAGGGGDGPHSKPFNRSIQGGGGGPVARFRSGGPRKGFRHGRAFSLPQSSLSPIPVGQSDSGTSGGPQAHFEADSKLVPSPLMATSIRPMPRGSYGGHVPFSRRSIDETALRKNGSSLVAAGGDESTLTTSVEARSAWRVHKPAFPIIKVENLPFATTVRDVENWLPELTIAPKDDPKLLLAVHLILHRETGRTLPHAYVEMKSIQLANEVMTQMDRKLLGDRTVRVKWERRGELMRDLFSQEGYFVTPASSPAASALPPVPSHYVLPQTILTRKDLDELVRHAEDGRESRERPLERAFLNVVTILAKFPWSELELYTKQQRDAIFDCAYDVIVLAVRKAQVDPDKFELIYELLKRAIVECSGFTVDQKEEVRALSVESLPPEGSRRTPVLARPPALPVSPVKPQCGVIVGPPPSPPMYRSEQRQRAGNIKNASHPASAVGKGWAAAEEDGKLNSHQSGQNATHTDPWSTDRQAPHTPPPAPPFGSELVQMEQKQNSILGWTKTLPNVEPVPQGQPSQTQDGRMESGN
ncbi:BQ2448_5534 [Microbotryum intermedium]|uniref:BQ2448_5534 protein n=1 Tax=Microbotryum intermedium TaxID=269621 RepID=A0A238F6R9_9BASI|nr:BQ2448_5534 [Microbotryum intermedium]